MILISEYLSFKVMLLKLMNLIVYWKSKVVITGPRDKRSVHLKNGASYQV
jgi:hypothetical protein